MIMIMIITMIITKLIIIIIIIIIIIVIIITIVVIIIIIIIIILAIVMITKLIMIMNSLIYVCVVKGEVVTHWTLLSEVRYVTHRQMSQIASSKCVKVLL